MIRLLVLVMLFSVFLHASDYEKYLKSETRAQIKIQKLVDDEGDFKEALKFGDAANKKFQDNVFVMSYYAKALYLSGSLDDSKIIFMKVLSIDPTNDIASEFVKKIEEQEAAKENKDLESVLGYLSGQGFDFLLIFLGFLGAEVLAKRYGDCQNNEFLNIIDHYIYYSSRSSGVYSRLASMTTEYVKSLASICSLLSIIVTITIAGAITITITWIEYMGLINVIISEEKLQIITSDELWMHFTMVFAVVYAIIVLIKIVIFMKEDPEDELDVANILQQLALDNEFELLKESIDKLIKHNVNRELIIDKCINNDAKDIIKNMYILCDGDAIKDA